jgi:hypothetical protein
MAPKIKDRQLPMLANVSRPLLEETRTVEALCNICGEEVSWDLPVKERINYPFPFVYYHGGPRHAIIMYIDAHYQVRGRDSSSEIAGVETASAKTLKMLLEELEHAIAARHAGQIRPISREISALLVERWTGPI